MAVFGRGLQERTSFGGGRVAMAHNGEQPHFSVRWAGLLGSVALCFVLFVCVVGAWLLNFSSTIVARGQVVSAQIPFHVEHRSGGIVRDVFVREGEAVEAGAILLRLEDGGAFAKLDALERQLFDVLLARARLTAERDQASIIGFERLEPLAHLDKAWRAQQIAEEVMLFEARKAAIHQRLNGLERQGVYLRAELEGYQRQLNAALEELRLSSRTLSDVEHLFVKGLAAKAVRDTALRAHSRAEGFVGELNAQIGRVRARLATRECEAAHTALARSEEVSLQLRTLNMREITIGNSINELREKIANLDVRAPFSGVVFDLGQASPQSVVSRGRRIMTVLPASGPKTVEAKILPRDVAQVLNAERIAFVPDGSQRHGSVDVAIRLSALAADAHLDAQTGAVFYRATFEVVEEPDGDVPGDPLKLGMPGNIVIRMLDDISWGGFAAALLEH